MNYLNESFSYIKQIDYNNDNSKEFFFINSLAKKLVMRQLACRLE